MDDFCDVILDNALDTSNGTMPPFGLSPSDYKEHRQWIQDLCEAPPGDGIVTPDPPPEELNIVSSPEVVKPIWKCTNRAAVKSGLPGADVTLHVEDSNGNKKFTGTKTVPPVGRVLFKLSSDFQEGDRVWATQTYNGLTSPNSKEVVVRDYFAENPNGPEPPEVWSPIHECSKSVAVDAINGVDEITVYRNGNFAFSMKWKADLTWASGLAAFSQGERVHAKQSICGKDSSASYGVTVDYAPSPLSKVELNPKANYGGQKVVDLDGITEGASMEIGLDGSGTFAQEGSYPFDWRNNYPVARKLGRALQAGDELTFEPELCDSGPPSKSVPVKSCDELPAPKIVQPIAVDDFVIVRKAAPGAKIRAFAGSDELGYGTEPVISLSRPLQVGETARVVQRVGECQGEFVREIEVAQLQYE